MAQALKNFLKKTEKVQTILIKKPDKLGCVKIKNLCYSSKKNSKRMKRYTIKQKKLSATYISIQNI